MTGKRRRKRAASFSREKEVKGSLDNNFLRKIMDILEKIIFPIQAVCMYASVATIFITVAAREIFKYSIVWGYEVASFFIIVLLFLGMPVNIHHNSNLKVTALYDICPHKVKNILNIIHSAVITVVLVMMAVGFVAYMERLGHVFMSASKFPNWLYYGAIGVGVVLSFLELLTEIVEWAIRKKNKLPGKEESDTCQA